ncbi:MAG: hypothetical protein HDS77_06475 [Bacteroidales bacterium]|nr:hypothetical protein [Bacteroidales bacterium]
MKQYISLIAIMLAVLTGCSDDNPPQSPVYYDIVCLEADSADGSVFSLTKPGSAEEITLVAPQRVNTDIVPVGNRLLLMYYIPVGGEAYKSGPVTVRGYGTIVNGTLEESDGVPEGWDRDPVYLLSAWQSGRYLNIHARLPYDENPRRFTLAMPAGQTDSSCPDIYLVHALAEDVTTFSRAYYVSFDISALVDDPAVTGFTLHLNNSNLRLDEIKFTIPAP